MDMMARRRALMSAGAGSGGIKLLASGTYTMATTSPDMYIPVSYSGTPICAFVVNYNPSAGATQALCWFVPCLPAVAADTVSSYFTGKDLSVAKRLFQSGTNGYVLSFTPTEVTENQIHVRRAGASGYDPVPGTYNWYIWGIE